MKKKLDLATVGLQNANGLWTGMEAVPFPYTSTPRLVGHFRFPQSPPGLLTLPQDLRLSGVTVLEAPGLDAQGQQMPLWALKAHGAVLSTPVLSPP